ncbi:cell surface glycoprotein 1-like [Patiria miniata]|uniref:Uncharacterized protein n=1 Tax=Patiria miniata TaxID=46514 RepID=A0A914AG83_PATMI|nr:cell surface glycoprotein 1-like [Patiria miniata]
MAEPLEEGAQRRNETQTPQTQTSPGPSTAQDRQATPTQEVPAGNKQPSQQEPTQQPPRQLQPRPGETQTNPGPSTAATQQLPADGVRDDQQTTQSSSRQPSQQEPTQQPPPQLQPRPGETQTNPGPSTAATQQLPADGVRDDQQTTQSSSRQPSQQEPMPQPPPQLQPRPGETQTNPGPSTAATQQLPADGVRDDQQTTQSGSRQPSQQEPMPQPLPQLQPRPGEAQINPGPSTAPSQQLPADGVRDDQQTTQSGSRQPSQQEPTQQPPPQLQPRLGETHLNISSVNPACYDSPGPDIGSLTASFPSILCIDAIRRNAYSVAESLKQGVPHWCTAPCHHMANYSEHPYCTIPQPISD